MFKHITQIFRNNLTTRKLKNYQQIGRKFILLNRLIAIACIIIFSHINQSYGIEKLTTSLNRGSEILQQEYQKQIDLKKIQNNFQIKKNITNQQLNKEAEKVAKDLQDVLASKLLNSMYEGLNTNTLFGGGNAERTFRALLNDERAKLIDLKLVEPIKNQIIKIHGGEDNIKNEKCKEGNSRCRYK